MPCVVFVDDDPGYLEAMRRNLRRVPRDWELLFLTDPSQALAAVQEHDVHVLVADMQMPDTDGLQMLEILRSEPQTADMPVLILTGLDDEPLKIEALKLGATDFASKQISPPELQLRIGNLARMRTAQRALQTMNESLEQQVAARTAELEQACRDAIWRLAKAGEFRDEETGDHVARVASCCRIVAEQLGMGREFTEALLVGSPLHDIGKIGIPDAILLKPGRLDTQERTVVEQHCQIGANILLGQPRIADAFMQWQQLAVVPRTGEKYTAMMRMAASIALNHHERWDGTGYPNGTAGDDIPVEARIVSVADVYDALRSRRPYKPPLGPDESLSIMRGQAGRQFDAAVLHAFEQRMDDISSLYRSSVNATVPTAIRRSVANAHIL